MKSSIESIIRNEIRPGHIFDAHTIIDFYITFFNILQQRALR